jgi:glutamate synthase (NADPH/NADH) small chain
VADPVTGQTGHPHVFSGGDCVNGGKEVVDAVAAGRNAARAMSARFAADRTIRPAAVGATTKGGSP